MIVSTSAAPPLRRAPKPSGIFPLRLSNSGRYLECNDGTPFFLQGDSPWSMPVQLTTAQMDTYLNDRASRGFNTANVILVEHGESSQTPIYRNVYGDDPFTNMTGPNWVLNDAYWQRVDYMVTKAHQLGILLVAWPAWFGYQADGTGWAAELAAASAGTLQSYGAALAGRYTQGNILWMMGGDASLDSTARDKQWNIAIGIRSVNSLSLISAEPQRTEDTYSFWSGYTGFNVNTIYTRASDNTEYSQAATAYAKSGPMPFFNVEGLYENDGIYTQGLNHRQAYVSVLSGAIGFIFGNNPLWGFGGPGTGGAGPAAVLASSLDTTGAQNMTRFGAFFRSYAWQKLQPKTDTSLVTTSLGTGDARVVPALASDGSFAMVWTRSVNFTVAMSVLSPSSVRARWFNPSDGSYSTVGGSPFANAGTQSFTAPGDRVLVLDGG